MVLAPTRRSIPAAALQRIGAPQEDPVLLLEAALRAVQALMLQRGPRMWRRCWMDQPYVREERELIRTELLPPLVRAMEELVAGAMGASVLPLPAGQDADGLIREQGASAMEGLIASGRHWLQWRLDRLLEPLGRADAPVALELLQRVERVGLALLAQLPDGVLRQTAEQRLKQALNNAAGNGFAQAPAGRVAALAQVGQTARQRAEQRALRLYVHGPECRPLLAALVLQEPSCRAALEWLCNLTPLAADGALAALALELSAQLPDAIGMRLVQAAAPGPEVVAVLQRDAQAELAAVLDLLEPLNPPQQLET